MNEQQPTTQPMPERKTELKVTISASAVVLVFTGALVWIGAFGASAGETWLGVVWSVMTAVTGYTGFRSWKKRGDTASLPGNTPARPGINV